MADLDFLDALPDEAAPAAGAPAPAPEPEPAAAGAPDFLKDMPDARQPVEENYWRAAQANPDEAAKVIGLSERLQAPEKYVETHLPDLQAAAEAPSPAFWTELSSRAPKTSEFLADPSNMKAARDDIHNLAASEQMVRSYTLADSLWKALKAPYQAAKAAAQAPSAAAHWAASGEYPDLRMGYQALQSGMAQTDAAMARVPAAVYDIAAVPQNLVMKVIGRPDLEVQSPEWLINNPAAKYYDEQAKAWRPPELDQSMIEKAQAGDYKGAGRILAAQVLTNAPSQALLLAGTAAGYGLPSLFAMGAQQAAQTNEENRKRGADPAMSGLDALTQGFFEGAFESMGTAGLFKTWENAIARSVGRDGARAVIQDALKTLGHTFLGEGNEEFWTSLAQDASAWGYGTNPQAMQGSLGRAAEAFAVGGVSGLAMTAPSAIGAGTYRGLEIQRANQAKNLYLAMGSTAEASALRKRLPAKHAQLVAQITAGSPVDSVYLDPETFQTYFQEKRIDPDAAAEKLGISAQLAEARQTGADIKIPMGVWIENVIGSEHWKALADDIKLHPEDLSVNQAKEVRERAEAQLKTEMEARQKDLEEALKDPSWKAAKDAAHQAIYSQLTAAGQRPALAKANAELWASHSIAEARRRGVPPDQLYFKGSRLPIHIEANLTPEQVAQKAAQSAELDRLIARRTQLEAEPASNEEATRELAGLNAEIAKLTEAAGQRVEQFAGELALTADPLQLENAMVLEGAGKTMDEIYRATGWFKGDDGRWRFEISDKDLKFKEGALTSGAIKRLGDLIDHPKLFAAYPELAELPVQFDAYRSGSAIGPHYDSATNTFRDVLHLGGRGEIRYVESEPYKVEAVAKHIRTEEELKASLMHEVQHAIQFREHFAGGGSGHVLDDPAYRRAAEAVRVQEAKVRQEFPDEGEIQDPARRDAKEKAENELARLRADLYRVGDEAAARADERYMHLAGEIEARQTAMRTEKSAAERALNRPFLGGKDAIIKLFRGDLRYAPRPGPAYGVPNDVLEGRTFAFKKWFKGSKVVDANGAPLLLFHGTHGTAAFDQFQPTMAGSTMAYFATDPKYAEHFAIATTGIGARIMPVFLSIKNPLDLRELGLRHISGKTFLEFFEKHGVQLPESAKEFAAPDAVDRAWFFLRNMMFVEGFEKALRDAGYDGLVHVENFETPKPFEAWVTLSPTQIKSAFNQGTWSPTDARILYQEALPAPEPAPEPVSPWYYSQLERIVESKMPNKAQAAQILAILKNNQVKQEEMDWTGIERWLKDQRGALTKQQVSDFLRANALKVEEVRHTSEFRRSRDERGDYIPNRAVLDRANELQRQEADAAMEDWSWEYDSRLFGVQETEVEQPADVGQKDLFGNVIAERPNKHWVLIDGDPLLYEDLGTRERERNRAKSETITDKYGNEIEGVAVWTESDLAWDAFYSHSEDYENEAREEAYDEWLREHPEEDYIQEAREDLGETDDDLDEEETEAGGRLGPTKWANYVEPGGENYGELVFVLPARKAPGYEDVHELDAEPGTFRVALTDGTYKDIKAESQDLAVQAALAPGLARPEIGHFSYTAHWSEDNPFAHVRFNERQINEKRTLFLEEIQSDWHQNARENREKEIDRLMADENLTKKEASKRVPPEFGYARKLTDDERARMIDLQHRSEGLSGTIVRLHESHARARSLEHWDEVERLDRRIEANQKEKNKVEEEFDRIRSAAKGPPNAPFKKTWHEFVFKRMLRWAAEHGFDQIAWTSGRMQAERWSGRFREAVDAIEWKKTGADAVEIKALKRGEARFARVLPLTGETTIEGIQAKLEDVVGDDLASRIRDHVRAGMVSGSTGTGDFVVLNPSGMEGFYDRMMPEFVNRYAKKWGARVTTGHLNKPVGQYTFYGSSGEYLMSLDFASMKEAKEWMDQKAADGYEAYRNGRIEETKAPAPTGAIHVLPITPEMKQSVLTLGQTLFQDEPGKEPRAFTTFGQDQEIWVSILSSADESTFAHEAAHIMLQRRFEYVRSGQADARYLADWQILADWLGVKADQTQLSREQHEQFARGFELYLREGLAPSENLRGAFAMFRRWLTRIYRDAAVLNVQVSDAVRGVMDRMLASEDEIAAAEAASGESLVRDIQGLAPEVQARLQELALAAHEEAVSRLLAKQMKEISAEQKAFLAQQRQEAAREAEKEAAEIPEQKALEGIRRASFQSRDGRKVAETYLDPESGMSEEDRTSWDMLAELYGYSSGQEMAQKILEAPSLRAEVQYRINQRMSRFADLRNTDKIREEAMNALHNDKQAELLAAEAAAFQTLVDDAQGRAVLKERRRNEARIELEAAKLKAAEMIGTRPAAQAVQAGPFFTAERQAAVKAQKALIDKDYGKAAKYKRQQLLNHALAVESLRARRRVERWERYLIDAQRKDMERFKKEEHFVQAAALLQRFGFPRRDYDARRRNETLAQWAVRMDEETGLVSQPDWLLQDETYARPYKELSVNLLGDLVDALRNISRVANAENTTVAIERGRQIDQLIAELGAAAERAVPPRQRYSPTVEPGRLDALKSLAARYSFSLKKIATILHRLNGGADEGRWTDVFETPVYEAASQESEMMRALNRGLEELWSPYSKAERQAMTKPVYREALGTTMSKMRLLVLALNLGNDGNREKVFMNRPVGVGPEVEWNQQAVMSLLEANFDQRDWEFVQRAWTFINQLWPQASAMHKELTGFAPKKVEPRPFDVHLPDGTLHHMEGGYFPLKRDPRSSGRAQLQETLDSPLYTEQYPGWKAMTRTGHLKSRVEARYPVSLEISIINRHLRDVVHDIAFRPVIVDLRRILNHEAMQDILRRYLGPEGFAAVREWVASVAGSSVNDHQATTEWEMAVSALRKRTTVAVLFMKPAIFLQNFANVFLFPGAVDGFGYKEAFHGYFVRGLFDYIPKFFTQWKSAQAIRDLVYSKSSLMADRKESPDFLLMETQNKLFGRNAPLREFAGWLMGTTDEVTNIPMWLEAYSQALERGDSEAKAVRYADRLIDSAVGSGRKYDQAGIARGTELARLFGMFYSFWSTEYQRWSKETGRVLAPKDLPRFLGFAASRLLLFNMASLVLSGGWPKDDENNLAWWLRQMLAYPMAFFPGIRDVAGVALDEALGLKSYGYRPSPATAAIETGLRAVGAGAAYVKGERDLAPVLEQMSRAAAFAYPYPDQINAIFWNAYDALAEGMQPQWRDLYRRRPKAER